jgi:hypothetical protein
MDDPAGQERVQRRREADPDPEEHRERVQSSGSAHFGAWPSEPTRIGELNVWRQVMDTGTSLANVPVEVTEAIYSKIPGAQFDKAFGVWTVPCSAEINVSIKIGGQECVVP